MILVVLHAMHLMLTGAGHSNGTAGGEAPPPADCAALGTCAAGYPANLYHTNEGCEITNNAMARANCVWGNPGNQVKCDTVPNPDVWDWSGQNGYGEWCKARKVLSTYPQGTFTIYDGECGCAGTADIYTD